MICDAHNRRKSTCLTLEILYYVVWLQMGRLAVTTVFSFYPAVFSFRFSLCNGPPVHWRSCAVCIQAIRSGCQCGCVRVQGSIFRGLEKRILRRLRFRIQHTHTHTFKHTDAGNWRRWPVHVAGLCTLFDGASSKTCLLTQHSLVTHTRRTAYWTSISTSEFTLLSFHQFNSVGFSVGIPLLSSGLKWIPLSNWKFPLVANAHHSAECGHLWWLVWCDWAAEHGCLLVNFPLNGCCSGIFISVGPTSASVAPRYWWLTTDGWWLMIVHFAEDRPIFCPFSRSVIQGLPNFQSVGRSLEWGWQIICDDI